MRHFLLAIMMIWQLAGCTSAYGPGMARPGRVAIWNFSNPTLESGCLTGLLRSGVRVLERQQVDKIFIEKGISRDRETNPSGYQRFGQLLGAEAFVKGNRTPHPVLNSLTVGVDAQLISATTGEIVRQVRVSGTLFDPHGERSAEKACLVLISELGK